MKIIIEVDGDLDNASAYLKAIKIDTKLIHSIKFDQSEAL